jgi:hypothetical protein
MAVEHKTCTQDTFLRGVTFVKGVDYPIETYKDPFNGELKIKAQNHFGHYVHISKSELNKYFT